MSAPTIELNTPPPTGVKHGMQYSQWAYTDPAGIVTAAMRNLAKIQFDTFVCRGISGILVAPLLACAMSKHFLIIRKPTDGSHSTVMAEGSFGCNWIFVDDFVSSGETRAACKAVAENMRGGPGVFVGTYEYQRLVDKDGRVIFCDPATPASNGGKFTADGCYL